MEENEVSEMWRDYHAMKQKKKRSNLAYSTKLLTDSGIEFVSHNMGIHLVITKQEKVIDFWPSTGLWWVRGNKKKSRGINQLIQFVRSDK